MLANYRELVLIRGPLLFLVHDLFGWGGLWNLRSIESLLSWEDEKTKEKTHCEDRREHTMYIIIISHRFLGEDPSATLRTPACPAFCTPKCWHRCSKQFPSNSQAISDPLTQFRSFLPMNSGCMACRKCSSLPESSLVKNRPCNQTWLAGKSPNL